MRPIIARILIVAVLACLWQVAPAFVAPGAFDAAVAQEVRKRRGWNPLSPLMRLFGPPRERSGRYRRERYRERRAPQRQSRPEVVRVRKNPDARRVLVVGDFMARGLFAGLDIAFSQSADVAIVSSTRNASGLANAGEIDWPTAIGPILDDKVVDIVVVMIGANDNVGVASETGLIQPENEAWSRAYGLRVLAFINQMAQRRIPVFWVGLSPMQDPALSDHASQVTAIFQENVTLAGGVFVDVWDPFSTEDGQYAMRGPDINGRDKQLRLKNGIGFTRAGYRKVAFFVEQELRSRLNAGGRLAAIQAISNEPEIVEVGSIIPLYDSRIGLNVDLLGGETEADSPNEETAQFKMVVAGEPLAAVPGRVDDFSWNDAQRR